MEQEKTNKPKPLDASGTLHGGLVGGLSGAASLGPVPKPPWRRRLRDLRWKALGTVIGNYIYEGLSSVDWNAVRDALQKLLQRRFGRKRQPATAAQV